MADIFKSFRHSAKGDWPSIQLVIAPFALRDLSATFFRRLIKMSPLVPLPLKTVLKLSFCGLVLGVIATGLGQQANAETSWKGTASTAWSNSSNWTAGVPTSSVDAIIGDANFTGANQPTVDVTATGKSLTLTTSKASTLTLTTNNLTVSGSITIGTGDTIASSSSANLFLTGDFTNNGTFTPAAGTVTFNGTTSQAIGGTSTSSFRSLTISNTSAEVTASVNFNVVTIFTVNASAVFNPNAGVVINSALTQGTMINSGTIKVTRTAATADFSSQYKFSSNSQSNSIVNYSGLGDQTVNNLTYAGLTISGSGTKTLAAATSISGNLTLTSGTLSAGASNFNFTLNSGNWINNGGAYS